MKALDARLLAYARATRVYLAESIGFGTATALLLVAQAWLVAVAVSGAFTGHESLRQLSLPLGVLLAVIVLRALIAWASEVMANRCSARAKSQLRAALFGRLAASDLRAGRGAESGAGGDGGSSGRTAPAPPGTGDLTALVTRGIDALDAYFSRYLPQLVLAVVVPLVVLVAVLARDWLSALIVAVTLPLIPIFMALIGMATRDRTDKQFRTLQRLAGHFLDVVAGLPTLKVFGRAKAQARAIRDITDLYRRRTMGALRITFLSSLVLELVSTLSVALVAVAVGLRLMGGHLDLRTALFVLVLAPEAYLPLRTLGANYHASAEGIAAAGQVFELLEEPARSTRAEAHTPDPSRFPLVVDRLRVSYPSRTEAALADLSITVEPGETVALAGPSGCGKSTLLRVLLGFVPVQSGSVSVGGVDLLDLDADEWRSMVAWMPQRPHLFAGTVADNVRIGRLDATDSEVTDALHRAGLLDLLARRPEWIHSVLGERGAGVSMGERQRIALARAFLRDAPLMLLDEPTANLDGRTEEDVVESVRRLSEGRTVLLVAHRPALVRLADRVVRLGSLEVVR